MSKPPLYWNKAKRILSKRDKVFKKIINKYKEGFLTTRNDPFFRFVELLLVSKFLPRQLILYGINLNKNAKKKLFLKILLI